MFGRTARLEDRLNRHEDVCGERYKQFTEAIERVEEKVEKRHRDNLKFLVTILLAVLGTLGLKFLDTIHVTMGAAH